MTKQDTNRTAVKVINVMAGSPDMGDWETWQKQLKALHEAMNEPTTSMIFVACKCDRDDYIAIWKAMLGRALAQ